MKISYTNDPYLTSDPEHEFSFDMGDKEWDLETLKQIQKDLAEDQKIRGYRIVK